MRKLLAALRFDPRNYSLRKRLIATSMASSIACGLAIAAIVIAVAWSETNTVFDDALKEGARLTLALGDTIRESGAAIEDDSLTDSDRRIRLYYQIISPEGTIQRRLEGAPPIPFVDFDEISGELFNEWSHGALWRVYVLRHETNGLSVQIGQLWTDRTDLLDDVVKSLALPTFALWLLIGVLNWWFIRRFLAPVEDMATEIASKSPVDMTPVSEQGAIELRPVLTSLNHVFSRLDAALQSERRFTADAAHELRTPLAAISSKIQLVSRIHGGQSELIENDLGALRDDVKRASHLVDNLLVLARLDPIDGCVGQNEDVDVALLVNETIGGLAEAARQKNIDIRSSTEVAGIHARREFLGIALRNLLDNAVKYANDGGTVEIEVTRAEDTATIVVRDDGPGVDEDDLNRLADRFYRVLGTGVTGSGLGLSIVNQIAKMHGGQMHIDRGRSGRGLSVALVLQQPLQRP